MTLTAFVSLLSFVFVILYFFARVRRKNRIVTPIFIALGLLSVSALYFLSDGIDGDVPPYFVFTSIISVSLVRRKYYAYLIALNAIAFVACYMIELTAPQIIQNYASQNLRDRQVLYAITALTIFAGAAFALFKNNYDAERRIVKKQNLDLQRAQKNLIRARDEAQKASLAKAEFLSTMSHEIRTPLNAVIGMSYILLDEDPRPDQVQNLDILKFSAENLLSLVNDVLDYSKIEAGKVVFEEADFHLDELLSSLRQAHSMKAEEQGTELVLYRSDQVPEVINGDAARLTQMLNNLLSNALKFTRGGEVELRINLKSRTEDGIRLIFNVSDTGIGIPKDRHESVFQSFTQADSDTTRKYGGTGLGLTITKNLVELMHGSISLASEPGKVSVFRIELPFQVGTQREKRFTDNKLEKPLAGRRLLLAEDNPVNALIAEKILSNWGAEIDHAVDGQEAVEKWRMAGHDLILMDLRMPKLTGIEAAKVIRAEEKGASVPIIALTASAMLEQQNEIFQVGMDEYVSKPFNPQELLNKILKHLD